MQILNISNFKTNYNISHTIFGNSKKTEEINTPINSNLSLKSLQLMKALNNYIETTWSDIKQGKINIEGPKFKYIDGSDYTIIKPIYGQKTPAILFENYDGNICQRLIFERENPNNFRYEKCIETDYGSAILKSYNSKTEHDAQINSFADNIIETTLTKILPRKVIFEVLPKKYISKKSYSYEQNKIRSKKF